MAEQPNLTQQGIDAFNTGDRELARKLLTQAVKSDAASAESWWYLAQVMDDPEKVRTCLHYVVRLDPTNREAQARLAEVEAQIADAKLKARQGDPKPNADAPNVTPLTPQDSTDGGFSLPVPDGIPGAPQRVTGRYLLDFVKGMGERTVLLFTQPDTPVDTTEATWWRFWLIGGLTGFVSGVTLLIALALINIRLLNPLSLVALPLMGALSGVVGLGAAAYATHWYLKSQHQGQADLLAHSYILALAWMPGTLANALLLLVGALGIGQALNVVSWLRGGFYVFAAGPLLMSAVALGVLAYTLYVLSKQWGRLYGFSDPRPLYIAAVSALFITALVF